MELEANLSLTLSKVLEEGKVLIPVFGPELTGMVNLGNTCYLNSAVQVLMSLLSLNKGICRMQRSICKLVKNGLPTATYVRCRNWLSESTQASFRKNNQLKKFTQVRTKISNKKTNTTKME